MHDSLLAHAATAQDVLLGEMMKKKTQLTCVSRQVGKHRMARRHERVQRGVLIRQ